MTIKEGMNETYNKGLENNQDPYGKGIYDFLERWADLMEEEINSSDKSPEEVIPECADRLSHDADIEGITGFMYGAAVNVLSHVWKYGEILRKWHNHEYNYDGDGVVNPAIVTVPLPTVK